MKMKTICCMLLAALLLAACNKDDQGEEEIVVKSQPWVTMITSVNGLGDNGYNDILVNGLYVFHEKTGVPLSVIQPKDMVEAERIYSQWLIDHAYADSSVLIVASSAYEKMVSHSTVSLKGSGSRVLLLESQAEIDGVSTFYIKRYGASYIAGALMSDRPAYVLAAAPGMPSLEESIRGFRDGHQSSPDHHPSFKVEYLADGEEGFAMPDSAYHVMANHIKICATDTNVVYREVVFPLLGSSFVGAMKAMGDYAFSIAVLVGIDSDRRGQSTCLPYSLVVHADNVIADYLCQWIEGTPWPATQSFGLREGTTDILFDMDYKPNSAMLFFKYGIIDMQGLVSKYDQLITIAIEKEEKI